MKTWQGTLLSIVVGIIVFLLLFAFSGDDSDTPTFYSVFGTEVPTDNPLPPVGASILAGGVTWILTGRPRQL